MTKNNDKKTSAETAPSLNEEKSNRTENSKKVSQKRSHLQLLTLAVALLAFIGVLYLAFQLTGINKALNQDIEVSNNSVASIIEQQKNLQHIINTNTQRIEEYKKIQSERQTALEAQLEKNLKENGYQDEDWQLHKAQYLLELVQINTHWQQHPSMSIALLQQADLVLKPFNNSRIYRIRQSIAKDIDALKNATIPDSVGILSALDALQIQFRALPISKPTFSQPKNDANTKKESEKNNRSWKERWSNSVNLLEKLVVIRYHHQGSNSIIYPEQQMLIKSSLSLSLQQAQWAVMQHNQALYDSALKQARSQLLQLSSQHPKIIAKLTAQLNMLSQRSVKIHQPSINKALQQLNGYIKRSESEPLEAPATNSNQKGVHE